MDNRLGCIVCTMSEMETATLFLSSMGTVLAALVIFGERLVSAIEAAKNLYAEMVGFLKNSFVLQKRYCLGNINGFRGGAKNYRRSISQSMYCPGA